MSWIIQIKTFFSLLFYRCRFCRCHCWDWWVVGIYLNVFECVIKSISTFLHAHRHASKSARTCVRIFYTGRSIEIFTLWKDYETFENSPKKGIPSWLQFHITAEEAAVKPLYMVCTGSTLCCVCVVETRTSTWFKPMHGGMYSLGLSFNQSPELRKQHFYVWLNRGGLPQWWWWWWWLLLVF